MVRPISKEGPSPYRFQRDQCVEVKGDEGKWLPGTVINVNGNQVFVEIKTRKGIDTRQVHERKVREPKL